jgi:hypothetical protein
MSCVALPHEIDIGRGRHLTEHESVVEVRMVLADEHRVPLPVLAIPADSVRNGRSFGPLASRPPQLDTLGHPLLLSGDLTVRVVRATD